MCPGGVLQWRRRPHVDAKQPRVWAYIYIIYTRVFMIERYETVFVCHAGCGVSKRLPYFVYIN